MNGKSAKAPMSSTSIYRLMLVLVYLVAGIYLIKDIAAGIASGAVIIAACLVVFSVIVFIMKKSNVSPVFQELVVSVSIGALVCLISLESGDYYSDDYCLYMAMMGLSGLFMEPKITGVQAIQFPVQLVIQYLIHPEKVESRSQFIMCLLIFSLASYILYLLVKRGNAFISISEKRADEAEVLMTSMKEVGAEMQKSMQHTTEKYGELNAVNLQLAEDTEGLRRGSEGIVQGTREVTEVCDDVHDRIQEARKQIGTLNSGVDDCETAIQEGSSSLEEMNRQMNTVQGTMADTNSVFSLLEQQMEEISQLIEELNKISASTTMLALNASIEAARAGQLGAGFAVVATNVQGLAVDSTRCAKRVGEVINAMHAQVEKTTEQLQESTEAIDSSRHSLDDLHGDFDSLAQSFSSLHEGIENQNVNIQNVEQLFGNLKEKVSDMNAYSGENQETVDSISQAMEKYQRNLQEVLAESMYVGEMSENMLKAAMK